MTDEGDETVRVTVELPSDDHDRLVRRAERKGMEDVETYAGAVLAQVAEKLRIRDRRDGTDEAADGTDEAVHERLRDLGYVD